MRSGLGKILIGSIDDDSVEQGYDEPVFIFHVIWAHVHSLNPVTASVCMFKRVFDA